MDALDAAKKVLQSFAPSEQRALAEFLVQLTATMDPAMSARTVRTEYRRCYGRRCRTCDKGGRHGPYLYEVWRDGDKVRRKYLRRAEK